MTKPTIPTLMDLERKHGFGIKTAAKVLDLLLQLLAIANREAALADKLAAMLEKVKQRAINMDPFTLQECDAVLTKHKEARK